MPSVQLGYKGVIKQTEVKVLVVVGADFVEIIEKWFYENKNNPIIDANNIK